MEKPKSNGLFETVDQRPDKGFFCMKLVEFINRDGQDTWDERFAEAKAGKCQYRGECSIYARTMAKRQPKPQRARQLEIEF